jgi:acyl dehydratase
MVEEVGMAQRTIEGLEGVRALVGQALGHSDWLEVTQDRVNAFADATLDHQWIHVDPERAKAESPFGGPIAHGYLTLSLLPFLLGQVVEVRGVRMAINYGLNRLRFPAPVPVGRRVRLAVTMAAIEEIRGGVQCLIDCTVEVEGGAKPALVAEVVFRYYA